MNLCGFQDLGYCGPDFTWCNMQEGTNRISLRLDRALATSGWLRPFEETRVQHMVESTSNHCILKISNSSGPIHHRKRCFHFEAMWVKRADCREIIESAWNSSSLSTTPEGVATNLQRYACDLVAWNKNMVGNISKKITEKRKTLNSLTTQDYGGSLGSEINQIRREINDLIDSEETIWHQ